MKMDKEDIVFMIIMVMVMCCYDFFMLQHHIETGEQQTIFTKQGNIFCEKNNMEYFKYNNLYFCMDNDSLHKIEPINNEFKFIKNGGDE